MFFRLDFLSISEDYLEHCDSLYDEVLLKKSPS